MTTNTETVPTFPPCPSWCVETHPGHLQGADDGLHTDGEWKRAHSGSRHSRIIDTSDGEWAEIHWGADQRASDGGLEYRINLVLTDDVELSVFQARLLAAQLSIAADEMEAAQR